MSDRQERLQRKHANRMLRLAIEQFGAYALLLGATLYRRISTERIEWGYVSTNEIGPIFAAIGCTYLPSPEDTANKRAPEFGFVRYPVIAEYDLDASQLEDLSSAVELTQLPERAVLRYQPTSDWINL